VGEVKEGRSKIMKGFVYMFRNLAFILKVQEHYYLKQVNVNRFALLKSYWSRGIFEDLVDLLRQLVVIINEKI
jgi:hypothetical protein